MDISTYREEIKLQLTGGVLELEIDDSTLDKIINSAFRELQRYIDSTYLETLPYAPCINLGERKINSVVRVFRAQGILSTQSADVSNSTPVSDPMYFAQWQVMNGVGGVYNIQNYVYNYATALTSLQIRNTLSTDLIFRYDKHTNMLYVNVSGGVPKSITVEYVPRFDDVSEITSDFWIDMLMRLSVALTKVTLGRVRSKYSQSNALWQLDGDTLLSEGNAELSDLRERLVASTQLVYPID